MNRKADKR